MLRRKEKTQFESTDKVNKLVEGTKIIGDIIADSNIRIDGEIVGNVFSRAKVIIGETGVVFGNISCLEADIEGKVNGSLEIEGLLILRDKSKIVGDILTSKLHIEEGAVFLGSCHMTGQDSIREQSHLVISEDNTDNNTY